MTDVAVLGAGSWGTTLADLLAKKGMAVRLWAYEPEVAEAINTRRENPLYLKGATLDERIVAGSDLATVVHGAPVICSVVPSHVTRRVLGTIAPLVRPKTPLICATKGMEPDTLQLMGGVAADALPHASFVALSGPSFAEEVHEGAPTAIVAASLDPSAAAAAQKLFSTSRFRVYTSDDVTGVTLAGALKNTMAIAAGILEGLGLGNNPRAALLTRGLAEISRLGMAMGASRQTFAGLAGMGDLILTCTGALSRNRQLGLALAQGVTLEQHYATHRTVVEGVNTARAGAQLAERYGVEMPITRQVAAVLFEGASPRDCIQALMERTLKAETWA